MRLQKCNLCKETLKVPQILCRVFAARPMVLVTLSCNACFIRYGKPVPLDQVFYLARYCLAQFVSLLLKTMPIPVSFLDNVDLGRIEELKIKKQKCIEKQGNDNIVIL